MAGDVRRLQEMRFGPKEQKKENLEETLKKLTIKELKEKRDHFEEKYVEARDKLPNSYIWDKENPTYKRMEYAALRFNSLCQIYSLEIISRQNKEIIGMEEKISMLKKGE